MYTTYQITFPTILFSTIILFFLATCTEERTPLTLDKGEISSELHKAHIGDILFMNKLIPSKELTEADFVKNITISPSSDFTIRFFLAQTLTYSLHELEPDLPVHDLCDNGNFQLTFYIDGKEAYQKNLQPGAGSCDYKNFQTTYGVPFVDKKNTNHWGYFLWLKFMKKEGGQDLLSLGMHNLKIEIRPYIEATTFKLGNIIAAGEVNLNIVAEEQEVEESKKVIQQIQASKDWEISTFPYHKENIRALNTKIAQNYFKNLSSIVVIKNGQLLIEEYFNGANRSTLHDTRSVGKSFASTLLGIAINEGHIRDENMTLSEFYDLKSYANYSSTKANITLKSLLSMSSPFEGSDMAPDSPGNEENMYPTADWVKFTLDLPLDKVKKTGEQWDYLTAGAVLIGDILNQTVPGGLEKYADEKLFKPMGITNYKWQFTPTNVPNTAGSFQLNALDYAKYGQLYLNKGTFKQQNILSEKWVAASHSHQIPITNTENEYYGYLFWNKTFNVAGNTYEVYYASGNGGNKIIMSKDLDLIIVITATAYGQAYMHVQADEIVEKYLIPAVLEE